MLKRRGEWLAYAGFFVNGLGSVLLGPMLPRLESLWGLGDAEGGALLAAQFLGMVLGTVFVLRRTRRAILAGGGCVWMGLSGLGLLARFGPAGARTEGLALLSLLVLGFGLGQAITALNLSAGAEAEGRASRLSLGNAIWSVGAICGPILIAVVVAGRSLGGWLLVIAVVLPVAWMFRLGPGSELEGTAQGESMRGAGMAVLLLFAGLMFLYGSAEACLSGWVTTFVRRAGGAGLRVSPLSLSAFWFGVAGGRGLAAVMLRSWKDRDALLLLVSGAAAASLGLVLGRSMGTISMWAALCGMMLGPVFALILAGALNRGTSSRQTGVVLAMCGLGASAMPLALGLLSERVNSLREALVLPGVCLAAMFLLVWAGVKRETAGGV